MTGEWISSIIQLLTSFWVKNSTRQEILVKFFNMPMETPADRLRTLRTELGLTGFQFAEALGITKSAVSYWEAGKADLSRPVALALEHLYGVSSEWLTTGEGPKWVPKLEGIRDWIFRPLLPPEGWVTIEDAAHTADLSKPRFPVAKTHAALWLKVLGGSDDDLYFWEAMDDAMNPTIKPGDMVLLHTGRKVRSQIKDNDIYLWDGGTGIPELRRMIWKSKTKTLLAGADEPGFVTIPEPVTLGSLPTKVFGRACWIGRKLPLGTEEAG